MALFGMIAKQWRDNNSDKKGNIWDYASINELIYLSNMENINAVLIEDGLSQKERLIKLNKIAIHQMSILEEQTTKVLKWFNSPEFGGIKISNHSSRLSYASIHVYKLPSSAKRAYSRGLSTAIAFSTWSVHVVVFNLSSDLSFHNFLQAYQISSHALIVLCYNLL